MTKRKQNQRLQITVCITLLLHKMLTIFLFNKKKQLLYFKQNLLISYRVTLKITFFQLLLYMRKAAAYCAGSMFESRHIKQMRVLILSEDQNIHAMFQVFYAQSPYQLSLRYHRVLSIPLMCNLGTSQVTIQMNLKSQSAVPP